MRRISAPASLQCRVISAKKWIGRKFTLEDGWHSPFVARALVLDLCCIGLKFGIVRIGMERKRCICSCVFMRAIKDCVFRERFDALQAIPELLGFSFEHTATAKS